MAAAAVPPLSQVRAWRADYLEDAATYWGTTAQNWNGAYREAYQQVQSPNGTAWTGAGAGAAILRVGRDRLRVYGTVDTLRVLAAAARDGASELNTARQLVLNAVAEAEAAGFTVSDNYAISVRDRGGPPALQVGLLAQAKAFAGTIRDRVALLASLDQQVAERVRTAAAGLETITFGEDPLLPNDSTVQLVDFRAPIPERPKVEPPPPPGGWGEDPVTRAAQKIAQGHAFTEHADDFRGMTREQLARVVEDMFRRSATAPGSMIVGHTSDGAPALYDPKTNLMVIRDVKSLDAGTVFEVKVPNLPKYLGDKIPSRVGSIPLGEFGDTVPRPAPTAQPKPAPPPVEGPSPSVRGAPLPGAPQLVPPPQTAGDNDLPILGSVDGKPDPAAGEHDER